MAGRADRGDHLGNDDNNHRKNAKAQRGHGDDHAQVRVQGKIEEALGISNQPGNGLAGKQPHAQRDKPQDDGLEQRDAHHLSYGGPARTQHCDLVTLALD